MPGKTRASLSTESVLSGAFFIYGGDMNTEGKIKACAQALAEATEDFTDEDAMKILKLARRIRKDGNKTIQNH
jgi:hypothetical protein